RLWARRDPPDPAGTAPDRRRRRPRPRDRRGRRVPPHHRRGLLPHAPARARRRAARGAHRPLRLLWPDDHVDHADLSGRAPPRAAAGTVTAAYDGPVAIDAVIFDCDGLLVDTETAW